MFTIKLLLNGLKLHELWGDEMPMFTDIRSDSSKCDR